MEMQPSAQRDSNTERDRKALNEILVTAILFGFTLNILSDIVLSHPSLAGDPFVLAWNLVWGLLAAILTAVFYLKLSRLYLGEESSTNIDMRIALVWDT